MKILYDFLPILLFFIAYQYFGVYIATFVAMVSSALQVIWCRHRTGRYDPLQSATFLIILVLGSATIFSHNPRFIQWKPTLVNWLFGTVFGVSTFWHTTLTEKLLGSQLTLSKPIWRKLHASWVAFFWGIGALNLYVVYHYPMHTWVSFKLFGLLGGSLLFVLIQSLLLAHWMKQSPEEDTRT